MPDGMKFDFEMPLDVFEKSDEVDGKRRRIGGLASVETKDRQGETLLQRGLDFESEFLSNGWFNDNHSKKTTDILGYPEATQFISKGAILPNGKKAKADGHWVEGYLLDTEPANEVWRLGKALQKTNRRLGLSVEGKILKRTGPKNKTIAQALVRNVAITNCPVNTDATLDMLAKSLQVVEATEPDDMEKMLSMGPIVDPGVTPEGPQSGEGAGQILTPESLEDDEKPSEILRKKKTKDKTKKSLNDSEIRAWFQARLPKATSTQIGRVMTLTRTLKRNGEI
jgi:hypothetical protein